MNVKTIAMVLFWVFVTVSMVGLVFMLMINWLAGNQVFVTCVNVNAVNVLSLILAVSALVMTVVFTVRWLNK